MTDPPREDPDADARRRRRAWIMAHHPDQGGDPERFIAGLADLGAPAGPTPPLDHRPTVYRSRSPWRRARRLVRAVRQHVTNEPRSRRLR